MDNKRQQIIKEMVDRFQKLGFNVSTTSAFGTLYGKIDPPHGVVKVIGYCGLAGAPT